MKQYNIDVIYKSDIFLAPSCNRVLTECHEDYLKKGVRIITIWRVK